MSALTALARMLVRSIGGPGGVTAAICSEARRSGSQDRSGIFRRALQILYLAARIKQPLVSLQTERIFSEHSSQRFLELFEKLVIRRIFRHFESPISNQM